MFVTTIIANYNYGEYILDAIDSCVNQTYNKHQICVVDNGSTDDSIEKILSIIENPQKVESNVNIVTGSVKGVPIIFVDVGQPVGPSLARNIGIELTLKDTNAYMILDADDIMMPNKIERMVQVLSKYNYIGVVYADYDNWNIHTGAVIREYKEAYSKSRLLQECIIHSGSLISRDALIATKDQFGFYDREMRTCEDYDLWIRISEKFMIYHIPEVLTKVRVHNQNSTNIVDKEIWNQNWQRINQKMMARNGS